MPVVAYYRTIQIPVEHAVHSWILCSCDYERISSFIKKKINRLPEKLENMSSEAVALEIQIMNKNITFLISAKSVIFFITFKHLVNFCTIKTC